MADTNVKTFGNRWRVIRAIGRGGQGVVYEVEDTQGTLTDTAAVRAVRESFSNFDRAGTNLQSKKEAAEAIVGLIKDISRTQQRSRGALKELLPIDQAVNAKTALERMRIELETLKSVVHPALITVLDDQLQEGWFVTEYFIEGTLADAPETYKGRALDALRAFRPIVDAVAALHRAGIVHRDIKPANVFLRSNNLVLGDCGLAFKMGNQDRITTTFENVGTRDYMPVWAYSMRLEDVNSTFDVYSLGKLLWAMVSARPHFPIWRFDETPHDLRTMFPEKPEMRFIHDILKNTVVEREEQCKLRDAGEFRNTIDAVIDALEAGAELPSHTRQMRCRFCGIGHYEQQGQFRNDGFFDASDRRYYYRCDSCGHLVSFFWRNNQQPPAWKD